MFLRAGDHHIGATGSFREIIHFLDGVEDTDLPSRKLVYEDRYSSSPLERSAEDLWREGNMRRNGELSTLDGQSRPHSTQSVEFGFDEAYRLISDRPQSVPPNRRPVARLGMTKNLSVASTAR